MGRQRNVGHGTRCSGSPRPASSSLIPFYLFDILGVPQGSALNRAFHGVKGMILETDKPWFYPGSVTE